MKASLSILALTLGLLLGTSAIADLSVGGVGDGKGGTVTGIVKFDGKKIAPKPVIMATDPFCTRFYAGKKAPLSERWKWGADGTLQNVFVTVVSGLGGKKFEAPKTPHLIDQVGCMYHPHVSGAMIGQKINIKNSDNTLHNVHGLPRINKEFNVGQPVAGMVHDASAKDITKAEEGIFIKCDVHSWMSTYLHVVEHPYFAVTQDAGTFKIQGLPAGTYELKFWHEFRRFAPDNATVKVTVKNGEEAKVTVTYSATKK